MNTIIGAEQQRLHDLFWRPGQWMHPSWWEQLELSQWQLVYQQSVACRPLIDQIIIQRKGLPMSPIPRDLDAYQCQFLALETQLMKLFIAMGLLVLASPDYLLFGHYRRHLVEIFGERGCEQLLAIGVFQNSSSQCLYSEDDFIMKAQEIGLSWWYSEKNNCIVYQALGTLFPIQPAKEVPHLGSIIPWLLRVGRFL